MYHCRELRTLGDRRGSRSHSIILFDNKETVTYQSTQWNKQVSSIQNVRPPPYVRESASIPPLNIYNSSRQGARKMYQKVDSRSKNVQPDPDNAFSRNKKAQAVVSYFRDRSFRGSPEQSLNNLIRDYEICASQQSLDPTQMSLFFINTLTDPAREFFLPNSLPSMQLNEIVTRAYLH